MSQKKTKTETKQTNKRNKERNLIYPPLQWSQSYDQNFLETVKDSFATINGLRIKLWSMVGVCECITIPSLGSGMKSPPPPKKNQFPNYKPAVWDKTWTVDLVDAPTATEISPHKLILCMFYVLWQRTIRSYIKCYPKCIFLVLLSHLNQLEWCS